MLKVSFNNKRNIVGFSLMVLFCMCCFVVTPAHASKSRTQLARALNRIVAVVNDEAITQTQLDRQVHIYKEQLLHENLRIPSDNVMRKNILKQMIEKKIQLQAAKKTGIRVSNGEINKAIGIVSKQNHISVKALYQSVQEAGITIAEYRQQMHDQIMMQKLQGREVASRIRVTPQEVTDMLRIYTSRKIPEYHLADILVKVSEAPTPEELANVRKHARYLIRKLKKGANFQKMAAQESDSDTALKGGDLGWRKLAELPQPFVKHVKTMRVGGIKGPIKAPNGYHILKLLGVKNIQVKRKIDESDVEIILLKHSDKTTVKKIYHDILHGADFSKQAKQYSQDSSKRLNGHVGWVRSGQYPKAVDKAIKQLKPGQVSEPISTDKGWYLVRVIAKRQVVKSTKAQREEVREMIFNRKLEEDIQSFLTDLRGQSFVKVFVKY